MNLAPSTGSYSMDVCHVAFQVVVLQMNGNDYPSNSIHVFHIGKLRLKLSKGKTAKAKEFYSSAMQVINCLSNFSYVCEF